MYKNGKRIGWIQHWLKRDTQLGRICSFQVDENERGKGYGTLLLNNLAQELNYMGVKHMTDDKIRKNHKL